MIGSLLRLPFHGLLYTRKGTQGIAIALHFSYGLIVLNRRLQSNSTTVRSSWDSLHLPGTVARKPRAETGDLTGHRIGRYGNLPYEGPPVRNPWSTGPGIAVASSLRWVSSWSPRTEALTSGATRSTLA